jgi:hypothetical protein
MDFCSFFTRFVLGRKLCTTWVALGAGNFDYRDCGNWSDVWGARSEDRVAPDHPLRRMSMPRAATPRKTGAQAAGTASEIGSILP